MGVIATVNNSLVAEPLAHFGSDEQRAAWLPRLATGEALGAFALSEEDAGTDAANQQTRATFDGQGYRINGRKVWVANAEVADLVVVFAATQPDIAGRGIANPIAMIASFAMCLRYSFNMVAEADRLEAAIAAVLDDGLRTKDIMSEGKQEVGTAAMGDAIIARYVALSA